MNLPGFRGVRALQIPIMGTNIPNMGMKDAMADKDSSAPGKKSTGMADALFPAVRQKVLALFFGQPDQSFSVSEVIDLANAGRGAVQREISRLTGAGLLAVVVRGRHKEYRANPDAPVFEELRGLVRKTLGPFAELRSAVAELGDSVRLAVLYGSLARGTEGADSDVDLLLVSDDLGLEDLYRLFRPVEERLARSIHPTLYTTEEFQRRREQGNAFVKKVLAGPYIVLREDDLGWLPAG